MAEPCALAYLCEPCVQWLESSCMTSVRHTVRQWLGLGIYWHDTSLKRGKPEMLPVLPDVYVTHLDIPGMPGAPSAAPQVLLKDRTSSAANHQWIGLIQYNHSSDRSCGPTTNKVYYDRRILTRHSYLWILWYRQRVYHPPRHHLASLISWVQSWHSIPKQRHSWQH